MAGYRSMLATLAVITALSVQPLIAQSGTATSIHTVSVTIPPRVKVEIAPSPALAASTPTIKKTSNLAVTVTATRAWTLSVQGKKQRTRMQRSPATRGRYDSLPGSGAVVASGARATNSSDATVYLSADGINPDDNGADAPVLITIAAQ